MIHWSDTAGQIQSLNNALIGKEVPVSAVRFGENVYHVIERATGKMKARRKEDVLLDTCEVGMGLGLYFQP
jgi:hypothetical protein